MAEGERANLKVMKFSRRDNLQIWYGLENGTLKTFSFFKGEYRVGIIESMKFQESSCRRLPALVHRVVTQK